MTRHPRFPDMARLGPQKDTRPERVVRMWLVRAGVRHRRNHRPLPGSPDFFCPDQGLCVFVDGRFWHDPRVARAMHRPHHATDWTAKVTRNAMRDRRNRRRLRRMGYRTLTIWDSDLTRLRRAGALRRLLRATGTA